MNWYLAVDPGADGALALVDHTGTPVEYQRMPPSPREIDTFFRDARYAAEYNLVCVFEEHKGGRQGGQCSNAAHKSAGRYLGLIQMACTIYNMRMICVTPQQWKTKLGLVIRTPKGAPKLSYHEQRKRSKEASITMCKELYPDVDLKATSRCTTDHDGIAEALLIATYARRVRL